MFRLFLAIAIIYFISSPANAACNDAIAEMNHDSKIVPAKQTTVLEISNYKQLEPNDDILVLDIGGFSEIPDDFVSAEVIIEFSQNGKVKQKRLGNFLLSNESAKNPNSFVFSIKEIGQQLFSQTDNIEINLRLTLQTADGSPVPELNSARASFQKIGH